jgi:uncharacterized protein
MQSKADMQGFVIDLLKGHLPACYYYHRYEHTLYVQEKALEIGRHQKCLKKELELISAAALWHDTGYINSYTGHEEAGCRLARKHLPAFGFKPAETESICGMIMATKVPQSPKNKLEEIVADADLEYLGTRGAAEKAGLLFQELKSLNPTLTKEAWDKIQIAFLQDHYYFTAYCREKKEAAKQAYLKTLMSSGE